MHPQLMGAAGERSKCEPRGGKRQSFQHAPNALRRLAMVVVHPVAGLVFGVDRKWQVHLALFTLDFPPDDGNIGFAGLAVLELGGDGRVRLAVQGHQHDA
ncbi:hypothetical protein D3C87_1870050 [compost metagenome]